METEVQGIHNAGYAQCVAWIVCPCVARALRIHALYMALYLLMHDVPAGSVLCCLDVELFVMLWYYSLVI